MSDSDCDNSPKALEGLLRKRASQKGVLTKHFNYFRDTDGAELDRQCLSIKEERLRATFDRFEKLNLEICALNPDADDCDAVETKYLETLTLIKRLMQKLDDNQVVSPPPLQTMATKLPEINVPIFVERRALALENAERTQVQFPVSKAAHTVTVKDVAGATVKSAPPPLACTLCAVAV
ncbi:uncharacterized protein LOC126381480 isoform X3 [Pectinophora gossypiella]|uniref:uncharacterized protein LOC126381480 isoform X3 n=1 Tax=Pectinophora gossypiella TaxID=13191 RepID=UPI00214E16B4|nr:uncharacterized protein LOC126381480 isoform X3 [Pectinophora gossypiella]